MKPVCVSTTGGIVMSQHIIAMFWVQVTCPVDAANRCLTESKWGYETAKKQPDCWCFFLFLCCIHLRKDPGSGYISFYASLLFLNKEQKMKPAHSHQHTCNYFVNKGFKLPTFFSRIVSFPFCVIHQFVAGFTFCV